MDSASVEVDTCNPVHILSTGSPPALSMSDQFEPLELIRGKCSVEEQPLWATPTSVIDCPLSEPMENEELAMGEDEMAEWLHCLTNPANCTQQVAGSSQLLSSSELLGRAAAESLDCQLQQPVLPDKDSELNRNGDAQSNFVWHNKSKSRGSSIETKSSTIGSSEERKEVRLQSTRSRKPRTAEIHNLSERRRRNRINEKMKALQEIIPRSNKLDKALVLDETIAYVKFLQMQVKMLSRRCATRPWMCPCGSTCMPSRYTCMDMNTNTNMNNGGTNRAMCVRSGMTSHAPTCRHMNHSIETPMFQMFHQHDMAMEMPSYRHDDVQYHFSNVGSGQVEVSSKESIIRLESSDT